MAHLYPSDYDGLPQPTTSTAVAIDKDKNSPYAVRWAIEHLLTANSNLILIHITSRSPDTGVNDSALDANGGIADSDLQQIFNPFRVYCARKRVTPKEVVIEDSDVSKALLSYINNNFIANVVLGAPTRNALARKFKNYDVPTLLNKHSPDFCSVYVIAKGKAVSIRPASRPAANSAMPPRLPSPRGFPLQEDIGQFNALYDACYPVLKTEWNVLKSVGDVSAKESNAGMLDGDCKGFLDQLFETNFKTNFRQLNAKILICVFWRLLGGFISTMPADVSLDDNRKWVCTLQDLFVFFAACQSNNVFQKHLHFLVTKCKISPVRFLSKLFTEEACGVCHSDLHVIKGELPFASPCVVGHEITGEVVEHGPLTDTKIIERFPVGAHVVGAFIIPCGSCFFCNKGQDDLCEDFFAYNRAKGTLYDGETRLFLRNSGKPVYMYSMGGLC